MPIKATQLKEQVIKTSFTHFSLTKEAHLTVERDIP